MARQPVDIGASPDAGGDSIRAGGDKINDNDAEIYDQLWGSDTPGPFIFEGTSLTINAPSSSNVVSLFVTMLSSTGSHTPTVQMRKARNNVGSPSALQSGDRIGGYSFNGYDGGAYSTQALLYAVTTEIWQSGTNRGCALVIETTPNASTTRTEVARWDQDGSLKMGGSNTVITASRHPQLRSYTVGTLPSAATAGQWIFVSDETGGAVPAFSDGTNWRRVTDRNVVS